MNFSNQNDIRTRAHDGKEVDTSHGKKLRQIFHMLIISSWRACDYRMYEEATQNQDVTIVSKNNLPH